MSFPAFARLTLLSGGGCLAYVTADLHMLVKSDVLDLEDAQVDTLSRLR